MGWKKTSGKNHLAHNREATTSKEKQNSQMCRGTGGSLWRYPVYPTEPRLLPLLPCRWSDTAMVQVFWFAICRDYYYCCYDSAFVFILALFGICRKMRFCHDRDGARALQAAAGKVALPWPFHTVTQPQRPSSGASTELCQPCETQAEDISSCWPSEGAAA